MEKKNNSTLKKKLTKELIRNYIDTSYFYYKVCEGCESVIYYTRVFCPLCESYRFDETYKRISSRIEEMTENDDGEFIKTISMIDNHLNE